MTDPYVEIAHHLPNEVRVGGALITLVEPHAGFESSYNRWYEDDHFYSGAMAGPWVFSGRRFVATRDLRSQRPALASPLADPPDSGCYISLYWITKGQEEPAERWGFHAMADSLAPRGRGFVERTHVYTAFTASRARSCGTKARCAPKPASPTPSPGCTPKSSTLTPWQGSPN